jgi:hypothetical protein
VKRIGLTFHVPVSVEYDESLSTATEAIDDFYAALAEAEQSGHFNRTIIDVAFGEYVELSRYTPSLEEEN